MPFILDFTYLLISLLASPLILFKLATSKRWRAGFAQRMGAVPRREGNELCIWIHAVSVGEVSAARPLINLILKQHPEWAVRISTTTDTGQRLAIELFGAERCFFFPVDLSFAVRRTFSRIRPTAIALVELELWPNFIRAAASRGVPLAIVNGRMSERKRSLPLYRRLRFLFAPLLNPVGRNVFCVQNEAYRARFAQVGFPPEKIHVTGNMKYESVRTEVDPAKQAELRQALGLDSGERAWIGACTWPGEEALCLRVHKRLLQEYPDLRLVLAPRHVERADEVAREIDRVGFACRRRSKVSTSAAPTDSSPAGEQRQSATLLDTVGELGYVYAFMAFAFIGKSFPPHKGGHNILEPIGLCAVPVFGPDVENFRDEARLLLEIGAAEQVADEESLFGTLCRLLNDPAKSRERAERGREALLQCRGAAQRNMQFITQLMTGTQ